LVGPSVDRAAHQLLGRGVAHGADNHVRLCQTADVIDAPRDTEVRQQNSTCPGCGGLGDEDVSWFHIPVEESAAVGIVEGTGDRGDDLDHVVRRHASRITLAYQVGGVSAVDVVHRDP